MAYTNAKLDVYSALTKVDGSEPTLLFSVSGAELIDWDIDAKVCAADNIFEIAGRKASLSISNDGEFAGWIATKSICAEYPEYMDAVLQIVDIDTGMVQFTGALPMNNIDSVFDEGIVNIKIVDSLDIWITQAKKYSFNFTDSPNYNYWELNGIRRDLVTLMNEPVNNLAMGLSDTYEIYTALTPLQVDSIHLVIENYADDFSTWQVPEDLGRPWAWQGKFIHVKYVNNLFVVSIRQFIALGVINNPSAWTYIWRAKTFRFDQDNMFQPLYNADDNNSRPYTFAQLRQAFYPFYGAGNITSNNGVIEIANTSTSAQTTIAGSLYKMEFVDDNVRATSPFYFNKLLFNVGSVQYGVILNAMITANLFYLYALPEGVKIIGNSVLSPSNTFTGGTAIADTEIFDQKRSGIFYDLKTITSGLQNVKFSDNLMTAILSIYQDSLSRISCKLSFQLVDTYYATLNLFDKIIIDSRTYIVTLIGYPKDGFIDIECIGEWN